ncbi:hypothetical protein [Microbacterium sp. YY-01]|uniref:hypothetical protein n=1 Tax=Microbacterium sp. YY-01 TaxID=3421634 RepID=UPI003D169EE7
MTSDEPDTPPRKEPVFDGLLHVTDPARIPGRSKPGYQSLPTGPTAITVHSGPGVNEEEWSPIDEDDAEPWKPDDTPIVEPAQLAPWALTAAIVAFVSSLFVAWGLPLAVLALLASIMCLRRSNESRLMSAWSLILSITATVYSAGWLVWTAIALRWIN